MHRGLGEPLPHQLANAPRVHPSATPESVFKSKPCGFDCYTVLAPVSKCYPLLMGRLPTCYSPFATPLFPVEQAPVEKEAFDLHVLGTPPAFVLSQDQTLIKFEQSCDC